MFNVQNTLEGCYSYLTDRRWAGSRGVVSSVYPGLLLGLLCLDALVALNTQPLLFQEVQRDLALPQSLQFPLQQYSRAES